MIGDVIVFPLFHNSLPVFPSSAQTVPLPERPVEEVNTTPLTTIGVMAPAISRDVQPDSILSGNTLNAETPLAPGARIQRTPSSSCHDASAPAAAPAVEAVNVAGSATF